MALKTIIFPKSLDTIGIGAFKNCPSLERIILPDTIMEIKKNAFSGCIALNTVIFSKSLGTKLPTIGVIDCDAFSGCLTLTKIVLNTNHTNKIINESIKICTKLKYIGLSSQFQDTQLILKQLDSKSITRNFVTKCTRRNLPFHARYDYAYNEIYKLILSKHNKKEGIFILSDWILIHILSYLEYIIEENEIIH